MGTLRIGARPGTSGTEVRRREPAPAIVDAPLGTTLLVGAYEWGPIDEVVEHSGESHYQAMRGDPIREDPTPLCSGHFYKLAKGAGKLLTLRLVDGDESAAYRDVYTRDVLADQQLLTPHTLPARAMRVSGLYSGKRAGPLNRFVGYLADLAAAADFASGTFATGVTMLTDQWKNAALTIQGLSRSFRVTSNTTAGVLSIEVPTGETEPSGAGNYTLILESPDQLDEANGIGVLIGSSTQNPATEWRIATWDFRAGGRRTGGNGARVQPVYESLSLNTTLDSYAEDVINDDGDRELQHWLSVAAQTIPDPSAPELRPANWSGFWDASGSDDYTIDVDTVFWTRTSPGSGTAHVDPTETVYGTQPGRVRAVCTFTSATAFGVVFEDWNGDQTLSDSLPAQALGTAVNPQSQAFPTFMLRAGGSAMASGDVITVYFNPLPNDLHLKGGRLYPHADDRVTGYDLRTSFPIRSNTASQVTLDSSVDLATDHNLQDGRPTGTAPTAGDYTIAGGETFIYQIGSESAVTLTESGLGAGTYTAAQLASEFNTREQATNDPPRVLFSASASNELVWTCLRDYGPNVQLTVTTGTMNTILGVTNDTDYDGQAHNVIALEYADALEYGLDGVASLVSADYQAAYDLGSSPINTLDERDLGLIKIGMPGVSDADAQNAGVDYAADRGYMFRGEISPNDATDEDSAAAWVRDNIDGDENRSFAWDSYGYVRNQPFPGTPSAYPLTGAILGVEAAIAADRDGYHVAAAGPKANVGELFETLESIGLTAQDPTRKDEATLNPAGIQAVQQEGRLIYPDGDRNSGDLYRGTVWKHKVEATLHIMHLLRVAGKTYEWEPNDPITRASLTTALYPVLKKLYDAGWFDREAGQDFDDVVTIAAGDAENPPAVKAAGELHAVIEIPQGIVDTAERVVFTLGSEGVTAS